VEFGWDPRKAAANLRKHKISFDEATTVFGDSLSATASDRTMQLMNTATLPSERHREVG